MENKKSGIGSFGMEMAAGAANTALGQIGGMIFGKGQDKRQVKQQEKLNNLQIKGNMQMSEFERKQQMKMWEDTNYSAQIEQAKKAGMSISALYGGSGAGGATMGSGGGAPVTGASAGDPNAGTGMGLQMASQLALMNAQKENIEADTVNKKATTTGTEIANVTNKGTQKATIDRASTDAQRAEEEMWTKHNERTISDHTLQEKIRQIREETITKILGNEGIAKENRKKEAEIAIREFEANMAKSGMSPNTPWYIKLMTDLAGKYGLKL